MKVIVEAKDIRDVKACVNDHIGLELTDKQARELFDHEGFAGEVLEYGIWDTCTREFLMDIFARKVVGRRWPEGRDGKEAYETFIVEFRRKAVAMGYKIAEGE